MECLAIPCPVGREQAPVVGELQAGLVERFRNRLGREHASLQQLLLAGLQALREETALVLDRIGAGIRKHAGHDAVGIDERTQHAVRDEQRGVIQRFVNTGFVAANDVFPVRETLAHARLDRRSVVGAPRQVELELEQLAQFARALVESLDGVVRVACRVQQCDLDERVEDEIVDRGVAVIRRIQVLVGADRVEPLGALVEVGDDAGRVQVGERGEHGVRILEVRAADDLEVAAPDQGGAGAGQRLDLGQALRAVARGEQDQRDDRRGRDRRRRVHAHRDLEGQRCDERLLALLVDAGFELLGLHQVPDRYAITETQVDLPARPAAPQEAQRPGESLRLLLLAALLDRVILDLGDLVVGDADRDERHVVEPGSLYRLEDVVEQAEARRQQLAGARSRSLQRPQQREALLDEVVDVAAKRRLVDLVVLERAPQEDDAGTPGEGAQARCVQVDAAERERQRQVRIEQHQRQRHGVEHRLVTDQEDDRARGHGLRDPLQLCLVDVDRRIVVAAAGRAIQCIDHLERERRLRCGHLAQVALGLCEDVRHGAVALLRDVGDQVAESRVGEDLAGQDTRHLVARAAEDALGTFQRDQRLVGDELVERLVIDTGLGLALAQVVEPGTVADDPGKPLGAMLRELPPPGAAGLGEAPGDEVQQGAVAVPVRRRQPGDAQRLQPQRIGFPRQRGEPVVVASPRQLDERMAGRGNGLRPLRFDPFPQQARLEFVAGVEHEHDRCILDVRPGRRAVAGYHYLPCETAPPNDFQASKPPSMWQVLSPICWAMSAASADRQPRLQKNTNSFGSANTALW